MRLLHHAAAWLLLLLGCVHAALTPAYTFAGRLDALWFAGAGLALCYVGALNILQAGEAGRVRAVRVWTRVANASLLLFSAALAAAAPEPQMLAVLLLALAATVAAFRPAARDALPERA